LGDSLGVGVSTDEFNAMKGKQSTIAFEARCELLLELSAVDFVFPEASWAQKPLDIQRFGASIFVMGSDWRGHFDDLAEYCDVVYLPRTEGVSSTEIRKILGSG
jgi:glycerol-3-phosphate cytidylyltransferase